MSLAGVSQEPHEGRSSALSAAMADALDAQADFYAVACIDLRSGAVLSASLRDPQSREAREALTLAALTASHLCTTPSQSALDDDLPECEAIVVSASAVHAFACSKRHPGQALMALARGGANVALLLASVRSMAEAIGGELQ